MQKKELLVAAIENGTVVDHIPSEKLFDVVSLLRLNELQSAVMIGYRLGSSKYGNKSIIKIADKFFSDAELNKLSVVAPNVSLSVIRDFEVVEKRSVSMPSELRDIVRCANPQCICNNEPMETLFHVLDSKELGTMVCYYCEKEQSLSTVQLIDHR